MLFPSTDPRCQGGIQAAHSKRVSLQPSPLPTRSWGREVPCSLLQSSKQGILPAPSGAGAIVHTPHPSHVHGTGNAVLSSGAHSRPLEPESQPLYPQGLLFSSASISSFRDYPSPTGHGPGGVIIHSALSTATPTCPPPGYTAGHVTQTGPITQLHLLDIDIGPRVGP